MLFKKDNPFKENKATLRHLMKAIKKLLKVVKDVVY